MVCKLAACPLLNDATIPCGRAPTSIGWPLGLCMLDITGPYEAKRPCMLAGECIDGAGRDGIGPVVAGDI
jgi:hypothetical protein